MTTISDGMRRATAEPLDSIRRRAEQEQVLFNPKDVLALLDRIAKQDVALRQISTGLSGDDAAACAEEALK